MNGATKRRMLALALVKEELYHYQEKLQVQVIIILQR
jgi:hypothetical protein